MRINKEDVKLIVSSKKTLIERSRSVTFSQMEELDMPKTDAERTLRKHGGDLIKTLHALVSE